jgi:hypothetical protein
MIPIYILEGMFMKTYLTIMFNSEGSKPSEVRDQLLNLGFKEAAGNYDFEYEWDKNRVNVDELVWFADKVQAALKNHLVYFTIESS